MVVFCTAGERLAPHVATVTASGEGPTAGSSAAPWLCFELDKLGPAEQERMLRLTNLQQIFETAKSVAFMAGTEEAALEAFRIFARPFVGIEAAGGVVASPRGEVLLIYRRGKWDLPKGKVEPGETPPAAAVREVQEECGIVGLELGRSLGESYHIYRLDDSAHSPWALKQTHWYAMRHPGTGDPTPQLEEEITDIRWVAQDESLIPYLDNSYALVRDVLSR